MSPKPYLYVGGSDHLSTCWDRYGVVVRAIENVCARVKVLVDVDRILGDIGDPV